MRSFDKRVDSKAWLPHHVPIGQWQAFVGDLTKELMKRSQVAQAHSTTYHPQTNGLVERQNRTLVSMLRVYCSRYMDDWDKHLPQVMGAYNSTEHSTTGISPHMMLTGHEMYRHHKMYRQFAKPPGQTPGEYSGDYPRFTTVVGDDKRYGNLKAPIGDGLFAAYDPLDMKAAKYLVVAGSDYLYTPRSLFWPDVIFLTAPKLDWGQAIGMMISVRRVVSMEPQVIVVAGSNDHLQSRGLLSRLTDGSIPSNEVIGEAIMTLLSAMAEVEAAARQRFTMNVVKVIFVLSPGYAALPEPLQFVYTMVTTIAEGIFNVIIPAPNRVVDPDNYYPSRSELPAVWADISNAIQGLRDCSTTRLVLDEVLGLELSNFARLLKLRPGVGDDHLLVQQVADDLWFRQMDHAENEQGRMIRKNMTSAEEDLMAMALRTKPHNNIWLYLSPRLCTLGEDAFEHAPAIIKELHAYLKNLLNAR